MIKQNDCHLYFQIKDRGKIQGEMKEEEGKGKNKKTRKQEQENMKTPFACVKAVVSNTTG